MRVVRDFYYLPPENTWLQTNEPNFKACLKKIRRHVGFFISKIPIYRDRLKPSTLECYCSVSCVAQRYSWLVVTSARIIRLREVLRAEKRIRRG